MRSISLRSRTYNVRGTLRGKKSATEFHEMNHQTAVVTREHWAFTPKDGKLATKLPDDFRIQVQDLAVILFRIELLQDPFITLPCHF